MNEPFRSSRLDLARHRAPIDADWDGVSERSPCPICGGDSGCLSHAALAFVCCARRPSEWPLTNGGWLHRVALRTRP
jgi:hypothetical protein